MKAPGAWIFIAMMVATAGMPAGAAYLPALGPGPLRFERPARPAAAATPASVLPLAPTMATETNPPPANPSGVEDGTTELPGNPPASVEPVAVAPPVEPPPATNAVAQTPVVPVAVETAITPQMLVEFFRTPVPATMPGTNTTGVLVTVPMFQPPQPARPPPSSARYESPEPRRPAP